MQHRWPLMLATLGLVACQVTPGVYAQTRPAAPSTAPAGIGTLTGKVLDKDGRPARNATVRALNPALIGTTPGFTARRAGPSTTADAQGRFTLANVPAGRVHVIATMVPGEGPAQRGQTSTAIEVASGSQTALSENISLAEVPTRATSANSAAAPPRAPSGRRGRPGAGDTR